ncbi:hypothetical protein ACFL42_04150 [Candidatus Omnitrophota bacterium]
MKMMAKIMTVLTVALLVGLTQGLCHAEGEPVLAGESPMEMESGNGYDNSGSVGYYADMEASQADSTPEDDTDTSMADPDIGELPDPGDTGAWDMPDNPNDGNELPDPGESPIPDPGEGYEDVPPIEDPSDPELDAAIAAAAEYDLMAAPDEGRDGAPTVGPISYGDGEDVVEINDPTTDYTTGDGTIDEDGIIAESTATDYGEDPIATVPPEDQTPIDVDVGDEGTDEYGGIPNEQGEWVYPD